MSLNNLVKRLQDIMRNDAGINGDAQRIEQMVWILFLKVYDAKEEIWEFYDENYTSIIPEELRWRNWAVDHKDGKALTGDALLDFVNGKLFPTLKAIAIDENTPMSQIIVRTAFEDNNNYMKDGILLRTDIPYQPVELLHIFLHELAHIYCAHHELDGKSFYDEYCEDYAQTKEEDGIINAGYAVWRECIAEIIAIELDDSCEIVSLKEKADVLRQLKGEIEPVDGKLAVSEILTAVMTSSEIEASQTWEKAETAILSLNLFDTPPEMDLFRLVYAQLRTTFLEIDVDFIHELGYLYLNILSLAVIRNLRQN